MKIRIVNLDFYMSNSIPNLDILYSEFRGSTINHVPVIRIYGSTEEGEKICLHIHRVFPYIYIPYDSQKAADGFLYQVASALDKAINLSLGQASANVQHVYKVCLVSGIPIYGYHARSHQFLKLYFYNPLIVKKACMLLQNGSILGKVYQPHEAHIPYILQFMIDYNLHGMSFIRLADMKYRSDKYSHEKYPGNSILPPSIHKMSVCKLEADATADCILNREEINPGQLTVNPGIRVLWEDEEQRRRNNGESSLVEHCLTQNRLDVSQTATHVAYKKLLDDKLRMKPRSSEVSPHLEQSIYPAETPPSSDVLDASIIENHIFSSQNTDDSSVLDETITENFNLNSNDLTLDEDAQKLFDLLQNLKEDNVEKDSILSQVPKEQESDEEEQDLSLPLNATQTPCKLDETSQKNTDDYLNQSYFESVKIPQLDGVYDNLLMENKLKPKRGRKKYDIEKKTSEAFQPTIPKAKKLDGKNSIKKNKLQNNDLARDTFQNSSCKSKLKDNRKKTKYETIYLGTTSGKKGRGRKMTFKVKTSAILYKSRSKYSRTPCQRCENNNNSSTSNKKGSPCIKHYFGGLLKISNVVTSAAEDLPKNEDHQEIESDIEKVIEDICQDINENTENKEAFNREVLNVEDKYGELTKYLKSELQDSTLDGAKFLTKVEDANDQNKSETRSKRKAIPTKRLLEETSQTCPSNLTRKPRNRNLCGKTKNSLTKFSSNCKTCENHVKLTKKSKANRRTHEKTKETTMVSRNKVSFKGDNLAVKASILQKPETLRNAATQIEIVSRKQQESSNCKEIDLDIEEVIKDICQDINEEITSSVNSKNKEDQIEESKAEILKIEDKYGKSTKISNSELEDSTVDRAKVSYQIKNVAYVQEIAKPIDQDSVESDGKSKVRNRRKSIPTKRLPDGTSQKCTSNFSRRSTHTSFKRKTKDVSTSTSDSKISRNRNKSSKKPNINERIAKYTKQTAIQSKDELIFKENNSTVPARILQKPETVEDTSTIMENISKTEKNNHEEIDLDIEKVIKDICQDLCEEKTPSKEILEISQNWSKATKAEKDVEGLTERIRSKETTNTSSLSEEDMKIKSLEHEANIAVTEILKISRDLQNLRKSKDFTDVEFEESEKVVNSKSFVPTTGGINDLDQIEEARNIQEFASKPADYNPVEYNRMVKGKNERKQDRVNETPQKCTSNTRMLKNCELNSSSEPSSNCKSYEDQQKAITTKKTSTVTGNLSDLSLKKCDILKKNIVEVPTEVLQKSGSIGVIVSSSHAQVNNGQDNINQVTDDLKELSDMLVVSAKNEKVKKRRGKRINKIPKVAQVGIEPEKQTEQTREDNIQRSPIVAEQERIEDSSKVVEIVNSPEENHHIQEDTGKTDKISIINDVQFTKEANGNPSEGIQIASLPKQTQQLQEEMANLVKLPIITDDKQRCLNVVDPPIIPQNYKSEKLDMPVLFDSFSNEYEGAIKNDEFYKPLKKRKHSLESIETPQIVQDRKFEENQLTRLLNEDQVPRHSLTQSKVSRKHSDDSDKYNLRSSDIGNNTDGSDKLKLGKSEKLMRLKNKRTQTENILCRPKGRPLTKPVLNFVLTRTQKKDDYKVRTCATNRKYVRTYELGPNPHPKFKIVPANKPYTFEPKKNAEGNYPNTTWIKCVESGRVSLDYLNTADIHNERAVIISNQLLEGDQKFEHLEIKKERVVDVIQPKNLKELSKREVIDVKLQNSEALSLGERKNVDTFVNLYDDIEPYLFEDDASPRSLRSSSTVGFSISKVFQSIDDGDIDSREESEDKTSSETSNIIISNPPLNQIDGVNIPTSLSNYRQDMKRNYDNLMEKLQRSFDNLFNSTTSITEGRSISSRLMLENLNGLAREHESKILVKRPFEGIKTDAVDDAVKVIHSSINKNSGDKRKTLTLPEYYKQIKVKCFEKSDHTFTLKVELPKKLRSKDDGIKTPKNSDMNNNSKMSLEVGSTVGKGSKRKIKKKIAEEDKVTLYPVNQYDYLDGPNDSSSDDEKAIKPTVKKRCRQPRKGFSQTVKYSPLKVNFSSPTKANLQKQAILRGEDAKDTSECQPPPKYKRKLSFSKNISLNRTEIEERLICIYKPKEKAQLKSTRKDPAIVVQDKVSQFNTEGDLKLHTQNEFDTTLMTSYQKVRTTMQIQHNKTASEMDTDKTNQNIISQEQNIFTPLITMDYQNIVRHTTQPSVPKQLFESIEHVSPNVSKESQKNIGTSSPIIPYQKLLQTKLEGQNRDVDPSLITSYQEQPKNSRTNLETENGRSNMKIESLKILGTAPISPYEKKPSKLSQNDPQVDYLDDMQLSNSSASLSDDIFSPSMPNSFSSEVSVEDKNQEINGLKRQARDPAELYDEKNKFIPQAGTSKFTNTRKLTQISESSDEILTPKPISLNSNGSVVTENELKLSADSEKDSSEKSSEIDRVTPYQKENVGFEVGEALCKSRIESSGSEITPYQKEQNLHHSNLKLTTCLNIFEFADQNLPSENGCKILVPKFQPPSRNFIEATMQEYNIPMESHQEPFYGDAKDVTGPMEVGVRILKIPSNKIVDITEFESSFKGINYYRRVFLEHMYPNEKITNKDIHNYKMSFYKSTKCIIIPAKLPPSRQEIELWLKSKLEKKQKIPKVIGRKKIIIPCSPGADNDSDNSLTVSPCTSLDETLKNVRQITEDETSKSSLETISDNISPMKKNDSLKCHGKGIFQNSSVKSNQSSENTSSSQELDITKQRRRDSCQITGVTLDRTNNFAISCDNLQNAKAVSEYLHLTVFSMELIIETRNDYKPNPFHDAIRGIVYQIFNDVPEDDLRKRSVKGCFLLNNLHISPTKIKFSILDGIFINNDETIKIFETETSMITKFVEFLIDCDPDILVGYEIQMLSWGYLIQRGYTLNLNLISLLSRVPQSTKSKPEDDLSDLTIPGRITLDFWRLLRHEIALQSYTFENIVYHILHQRVPLYSFRNITFWWNHVSGLYRNKVLRYYFYRVEATLRIMDQLDLIGRTSELAKLFGIQFFEVLSRGSQFRVESMMLRLAKPLNYIPVSPSVQQRANMRAPESLPLIMEPQSKFYADPVIVLDFQSLYPSMIIAYNYCFSTCLGRIEHLGRDIPFEFGATQLKVPRKYIKRLSRKDVINISPCGVGFVKKTVREGILPRMLQEILDTRLMVKKSLKKNAGNKTLEKVLDARQLGLKLIANVTYGYTAANFSGRMPCIEVGDSVVSKGRETLQRAINLVERTPKWGAKVVYGDTDSLFVLVPGKSRQEAFKIGAEIAEAVTNDNPSPVKLKLEKVFHPCILQTKKRYVGYMYESPEQDEPEYLAKGIETVRRDGCPAVSKILEKCLKILFDTRDVSLVRQYVVRQFSKILSGRVSIQDLTFAKEYRGASSYRPGACVPALELTRKWLAIDKRNEPRRGERVPYVIVSGPPGLPLIRLVRCPRELIADPALRPNALYYITKVIIPPINRCLLLIGADVNNWFNDMPRKQYQYLHTSSPVKGKKSTISQYFTTKKCVICGLQSKDGICEVCLSKPQNTSVILHEKVRVLEQNCYETKMICESCCGTSDKVTCISLDCPVYYKRIQTEKEVQQTPFIRELISLLPNLDF